MMYEYLGKEQIGKRTAQYIFKDEKGKRIYFTSAEVKVRMTAGDVFPQVKLTKNGRLYIKKNTVPQTGNISLQKEYAYEVTTGGSLYGLVHQYLALPRRDLVLQMADYLKQPFSGSSESLCVLYGVRGTGKTTALIHGIEDLLENGIAASDIAYIRAAMPNQYFEGLRKRIEELPCKYLFLDDITQIEDLAEQITWLSDRIALKRKIVIAGADNFLLSHLRLTSLFGRAIWLKATLVEYSEWCRIMQKRPLPATLDEYLIYGGSLEKEDGRRNLDKVKRFLEAAVFHNVRNSIKRSHVELLQEETRETAKLSAGQLTELICTIIFLSVRPRNAGWRGFQEKLPSSSQRMDFSGMDTSFMEQISPGLLSEVCKILHELDMVTQIPNVVRDDNQRNLKRSTDLEFVTLIQGLLYTVRHHTFRPDENDMTLLFRNLIISQILVHAAKKNSSMQVGYCQYEYNRLTYAVDCVVRSQKADEQATPSVTAIEMTCSDRIQPEFTQHLQHPSLEMAVPQITRRLVVYRGETRKESDVDFVNAHEFVMNLKTWLE